jgi:hypothetical protein
MDFMPTDSSNLGVGSSSMVSRLSQSSLDASENSVYGGVEMGMPPDFSGGYLYCLHPHKVLQQQEPNYSIWSNAPDGPKYVI